MAGIYIHIPFCKQKCTYCDFHFSTNFEDYRSAMIDAICTELSSRIPHFIGNQTLKTIYFGGGTPSILTSKEINIILATISTTTNTTQVEEITLEANPDDIDEERLLIWKNAGITRLSIGLQSFRQRDLEWMNRAHNDQEGEQAIRLAQKFGFNNITVDLMYGLPNLTIDEWREHINRLITMKVPHISAYCLTVEQNTALKHMVEKQAIALPDEDTQSQQFEVLIEEMEKNGYEQYEISNFSLPNKHAIHNSNYWKDQIYLGVGPSAHSYDHRYRYWNISNNRQYIKGITNGEQVQEKEELSPENRFNELLLTGLRTKWGVSLDDLSAIHAIDDNFLNRLHEFSHQGDLTFSDQRISLTKKGKLKADYIASSLFLT